jgi:hypothetical protein
MHKMWKNYVNKASRSKLYQQKIYLSLNHIKINIMKTRKHFIRKYELLARCIQTNLELFILQ